MHHFGSISNKIEDQSAVVFVRKNGINRNDEQNRFCQFDHKVQAVFQQSGHRNDFPIINTS